MVSDSEEWGGGGGIAKAKHFSGLAPKRMRQKISKYFTVQWFKIFRRVAYNDNLASYGKLFHLNLK